MNRNAEAHYTQVPRANIQRARFKRDYSSLTAFNEGDLIPIYVDEVLPGDTVSINQNGVIRMSTPLYPVMDNCFIDYFYFFVPNRLLWEHWQNLMGENTSSAWAPTVVYTTPKTVAPSNGWSVGTIADYMGIPTGIANIKVNSMPFRAYARIWNEWFRDENLQQPVVQDTNDATAQGVNTGTNLTDAEHGGLPLKSNKTHDYFTSALPAPQKGAAVQFNLAAAAPVKTGINHPDDVINRPNLQWITRDNSLAFDQGNATWDITGLTPAGQTAGSILDRTGAWAYGSATGHVGGQAEIVPMNLWADLSTVTGININDLRQAIAVQQILEADARGGSRYTELLANEWGVTSPDARLQRSEYIGGARVPINVNQVIQSEATTSATPQGHAGAYSLTTMSQHMCSYSATEHGYIIGLATIRVDHSYQQGLRRMWTRTDRFSYYHPLLANLGETAILNQEIYATGGTQDEEVFGYQEAWADYRYRTNEVTSIMRSQYAQSLDAWHYADFYSSRPTLSSSWIQEEKSNIERTLAVQDQSAKQFICNFYFDQTWTRPMPIYSIPGLERI